MVNPKSNSKESGFGLVEILVAVGLAAIFFVVAIMITSSISGNGANDRFDKIKVAIAEGMVVKPTANNLALVKDEGDYYIFLWGDNDQKAYQSKPLDLGEKQIILTGTPSDYKIRSTGKDLFQKVTYKTITVSVPGYQTFTREIYDDKTRDRANNAIYSSLTEEIIQK